jgi:hypothetical protein
MKLLRELQSQRQLYISFGASDKLAQTLALTIIGARTKLK